MALRHGGYRVLLRARLGGAVPADITGLRRTLGAVAIALILVAPGWALAELVAQLPGDDKETGRSETNADKPDDDDAKDAKADAKDDAQPADPEAGEPEDPGTRKLEVTGIQCEALAMGKSLKDLPPDSQVEAITFVDPPPVTYHLPEQRRESLTECSLRASGLTVRVDPARKVITLLPTGTGSPEMPNPTVKVMVKLSEAPAKSEQ